MIKTPEQQLITINESSGNVTVMCKSNGAGGSGLIINGWSSSEDDHILGGEIFDDQFKMIGFQSQSPEMETSSLLCFIHSTLELHSKLSHFLLHLSLLVAFSWQLYTTWILVHLSEPVTGVGTRHSRYLRLAIAAFWYNTVYKSIFPT
ncbi:hypothetical protein QYF36_017251 [Acer negundo]|nr:hypothetical protein QYF36_017251 [Acer negundo]